MEEPLRTALQFSKLFLSKEEVQFCQRHTISDAIVYATKKREVFSFIKKLVVKLKVPLRILQSFGYYFQRFFLFNDFKQHLSSLYEVAVCALFIAMKNNDCIKRIKEVIAFGNQIRNVSYTSETLDEQRKRVFSYERRFLEVISFDFRSFSAEDFLIKYSKTLEMHRDVVYLAWVACNDTYLTELVLTCAPYNIAQACLLIGMDVYAELYPGKLDAEIETWRQKMANTRRVSPNPFHYMAARYDMLGFYVENWESTFMASMVGSHVNDHILNIKVRAAEKNKKRPRDANADLSKDLFFQQRNYDLGKVGTVRFLYHKREFVEEVNKTV